MLLLFREMMIVAHQDQIEQLRNSFKKKLTDADLWPQKVCLEQFLTFKHSSTWKRQGHRWGTQGRVGGWAVMNACVHAYIQFVTVCMHAHYNKLSLSFWLTTSWSELERQPVWCALKTSASNINCFAEFGPSFWVSITWSTQGMLLAGSWGYLHSAQMSGHTANNMNVFNICCIKVS